MVEWFWFKQFITFSYCLSYPGCIDAVTLEVKESNTTCIKADLSASFSIIYNTTHANVCTDVCSPTTASFLCVRLFICCIICCVLREQCRSFCPTLPQWIQQTAHVAKMAAPPGWWQYLDLATLLGWTSQPMEPCIRFLAWLCSTT